MTTTDPPRAAAPDALTAAPFRLCVLAGMPRAGTTSLFHMLGTHPSVFLPFRKEMGYFLFNWHRGAGWYRRHYRGMTAGQVGVDATPEYFFSDEARERIKAFGGDTRVLLGVRHPAEMGRSLYAEYAKRYRMPPFESFVREYAYRRGRALVRVGFADGEVPRAIEAYRATFANRLLLYDFRVLALDPQLLLEGIEEFLGLPAHFAGGGCPVLHLNAHTRRNWRTLSFLASREWLISAASALLPARWLRGAARRFYGLAPARATCPNPLPPTAGAARGLATLLAENRDPIEELFADGPIVDGRGRTIRRWRG